MFENLTKSINKMRKAIEERKNNQMQLQEMKNTVTERKIHWLNVTTQQTQKHNKNNRKKDQ